VFFKLLTSQNAAKINQDQPGSLNHEFQLCIAERERFPDMNDMIWFRKTQIRTSAREISRLNFPYNQLISPDLSEISRLKNNSTD